MPSSRILLACALVTPALSLGLTLGLVVESGSASQAPTGQTSAREHVTASAKPTAQKRQARPNVLLITTDDQADIEMRSMPRTRRLLARAGADFVNAISPHPLCCPARAEIMTGEFAHNNGVKHNTGPYGGYRRYATANGGSNLRENIGIWMRRAGYTTGFTGKMLNGYSTSSKRPSGWGMWDPSLSGTYAYYGTQFFNDGRPETPKGYVVDVVADRASEFIRSRAKSRKPFFLWASHVAPHDAIDGGKTFSGPRIAGRHRHKFRSTSLPAMKKPSFNERDVSDKPRYMRRERLSTQGMVEAYRKRQRSLAAVDEANARMIGALRKAGELSNTLVIFTSDNGYLFGEHRLETKNFVYDENLQVPLLIRGPGVPAGSVYGDLATTVDLAPTILDAAGAWGKVRRSGRTDGVSLLRTFRGRSLVSDTSLIQAGGVNRTILRAHDGWLFRGVTTGRYTYARHWKGSEELYDRRVDPYEMRNLVNPESGVLRSKASEYAAVLAALAFRLDVLESCHGATQCERDFGPLPEPVG